MTPPGLVVFLLDVDSTLLDNDRIIADLKRHRAQAFGPEPAAQDRAPLTVSTVPEATPKALADHGEPSAILPADGGDCEEVLAGFAGAGVDIDVLAAQLQDEGARSFVKSGKELLECIDASQLHPN